MTDQDDARDAALFRFWCRMAEQEPGRTARALTHCLTEDDYRNALTGMARSDRINLPGGAP